MPCTTKAEYLKPEISRFRNKLEQRASQQELYVTKVQGTLDCVPTQIHNFFRYPLPQPWKSNNNNKEYLQTDELIKMQHG